MNKIIFLILIAFSTFNCKSEATDYNNDLNLILDGIKDTYKASEVKLDFKFEGSQNEFTGQYIKLTIINSQTIINGNNDKLTELTASMAAFVIYEATVENVIEEDYNFIQVIIDNSRGETEYKYLRQELSQVENAIETVIKFYSNLTELKYSNCLQLFSESVFEVTPKEEVMAFLHKLYTDNDDAKIDIYGFDKDDEGVIQVVTFIDYDELTGQYLNFRFKNKRPTNLIDGLRVKHNLE